VFIPWFPHTPEPKIYKSAVDLVDIDSNGELFKRITQVMYAHKVNVLVQPVPHITELVTGLVEQGQLHVLYGDTLTGETTAAIVLDFVTEQLQSLIARNTPKEPTP